MYIKDIDIICNIAEDKYKLSKKNPSKYLTRAIVAGLYLVVAIILSYTTGAVLYDMSPEISRVMVAATFSLALGLIAFLGGELFTGNNLVMALGVYNKRCRLSMAIRVWIFSYIGNFIGSVILSFIFVKSGASLSLLQEYTSNIVYAKLELPVLELFLRGVLCNFMVCIAVLSSIKMKTEGGKLTIMFWCIFAFVIAGFEHSIANMGIFSVSYLALGGLPLDLVFRNLLWVTLGNIVGGAVLLALPLKLMSYDDVALKEECIELEYKSENIRV
ncbi:formate/nitrite transporter family protein [Romboutsia weinsteinii]|uniref:Formate/nitrite transporter family protein n=1 Tax=Romboutsia weinsteinii TaxID=2020949 RepID=A0A371J5X3_9FIRM|nr:formate/nitrite transporter family protein [Romboutsia weinsteinii]RDY28083.1 formate/nitrite transporter family protein [Romboutsia weinsteinii]